MYEIEKRFFELFELPETEIDAQKILMLEDLLWDFSIERDIQASDIITYKYKTLNHETKQYLYREHALLELLCELHEKVKPGITSIF